MKEREIVREWERKRERERENIESAKKLRPKFEGKK